jgi:hypothetical protein
MGGVPFPKIPSYFFAFFVGGRLRWGAVHSRSDLRPFTSPVPLPVQLPRGERFAVPIVGSNNTI